MNCIYLREGADSRGAMVMFCASTEERTTEWDCENCEYYEEEE